MRYIILVVLSPCFYLPFGIADELFISIDQYGNKVFADKAPDSGNFIVSQQKEVASTKWIKTPELKTKFIITPKKKKRRKKQNSQDLKSKQCNLLSQKVNQLQDKLRRKQKIEKFDLIKRNLRRLRWQYQKAC